MAGTALVGYFKHGAVRITGIAMLALLAFSVLPAQAQWTALTAPGQATRNVAGEPTVLAIAKNARILAVGHSKSKSVAFYNPDTAALLGSTTLPKEPVDIVLSDDGSVAFALYESSGIKIAAINTATRAIANTWSIAGEPAGMVLNGSELLVADKDGNRLVGINRATGVVTRTKSLTKQPLLIGINAASTLILVGVKDGELQLLDSGTLAVTRSVTVGDDIRSLAGLVGGYQ